MKTRNLFAAILIVTMPVLHTACNDDDDDNNVNALSEKDRDFMNKATYSNLGEVASGNIARQKAMNTAVVNFGNMMVTDHSAAHTELSEIAQDKGTSLPADTDQEHKNMAATLSTLSGDAFDSTYMYMMVQGHDKAIALFQDEVTNGLNRDIKNYAQAKLPTLEHHRHMADSIARALYPR